VFETSTAKDGVIFYVIRESSDFLSLLQSSITVSFSGAAAILSTNTPYSLRLPRFFRDLQTLLSWYRPERFSARNPAFAPSSRLNWRRARH
jgi:hypothetical protein